MPPGFCFSGSREIVHYSLFQLKESDGFAGALFYLGGGVVNVSTSRSFGKAFP